MGKNKKLKQQLNHDKDALEDALNDKLIKPDSGNLNYEYLNKIEQLETKFYSVCMKNLSNLKQIGISARRMQGKHFYEWLVRWFNPAPAITGGDQDDLLKAYPYPGEQKPHGWNFCQNVFLIL